MWPVIVRELRAGSRARGNYWLRVLAVGAACATAFVAGLLIMGNRSQGKDVFAALHLVTFCAIWLFVPLVTADCLSRERREGTLGLLFLTPLKPLHITVAKTITQSARAFTMWLATLPVLVLPLLMGGVTRTEALLSVLINATSFCLALAVGIWTSSRSTLFHRSIIAAGIVATVVFLSYLFVNTLVALAVFVPLGTSVGSDILRGLFVGFVILGNIADVWSLIPRNFGALFSTWVWALGGLLCISMLVLGLLTWRAARVLQANWQVGAAPSRWTRVRERLCTPVIFQNLYRRWLQWSLNRNPVGWLERRRWNARTVKWAWLAILTALYSFILTDGSLFRSEFTELQLLLAAGLVTTATISAAGSFRRERDNGVLVLLLVSPLRAKHIVGGRLCALWSQYVPSLCLLFGAWLYLHKTLGHSRDEFWMAFFLTCFLTVPVIGLYCSLQQRTFFASLFWTGLLAFVAPVTLSAVVAIAADQPWVDFHLPGLGPNLLMVAALAQIAIASACLVLLLRNLSQRFFTLRESCEP